MCLAEFAATYVTIYQCQDTESDGLPPIDIETTYFQITMVLPK